MSRRHTFAASILFRCFAAGVEGYIWHISLEASVARNASFCANLDACSFEGIHKLTLPQFCLLLKKSFGKLYGRFSDASWLYLTSPKLNPTGLALIVRVSLWAFRACFLASITGD